MRLLMTASERDRTLDVLRRALEEDLGPGDITSHSILPPDLVLSGSLLSREEGIIAGLEIAGLVFQLVDKRISIIFLD